ncbi:site-specific tyrosine recombinase XerD [bacterium]|nr:site-specific tyrosine recombinase XerD [bacterium]
MNYNEFVKYVADFLVYAHVEKNLSHNTIRSYKSDLSRFSNFWQRINETEGTEVLMKRAFERYFLALFHEEFDKSSVARKVSCFTSFEDYMRTLAISLSLNLKRPHIDKKLPVYLTVDEIFYLLDTIKNEQLPTKRPYRDKAVFELLYATGMRCSELCSIEMHDIDLENKVIKIYGKGRKERLALFGTKAKERLEQYLKYERRRVVDYKEKLFVNSQGEPLTPRTIQRIILMFRRFLKGNKLVTPHKIRHSFATHLLNSGADLRVVQELLGHQTLASTEKYTHVTGTRLAEIYDTMHPLSIMKKLKPAV